VGANPWSKGIQKDVAVLKLIETMLKRRVLDEIIHLLEIRIWENHRFRSEGYTPMCPPPLSGAVQMALFS